MNAVLQLFGCEAGLSLKHGAAAKATRQVCRCSTGMRAGVTWRGLQDVFCTTSRTKPVLRPGHLAKGRRAAPCWIPPADGAASASSLTAPVQRLPLHRQSGRSCPDTLTNLAQFGYAPTSSRLDCDRASCPRSPDPHRPTLRGLDARWWARPRTRV